MLGLEEKGRKPCSAEVKEIDWQNYRKRKETWNSSEMEERYQKENTRKRERDILKLKKSGKIGK